jgi:tripartite-type tricarboxylate transporter receptor subunit TctC
MNGTRRALLQAGLAGLVGTGAAAQGSGGDYPNRAIALSIAFSAGGATDRQIRLLARLASATLMQPIVVDNKPGAAGSRAAAMLVGVGRPDGYAIAQGPVGLFRVPHMQRVGWDPLRDFTYIIGISGYVLGVAVRADSPFRSWYDVERHARAHPGDVTFASTGAGGTPHLAMEEMALRADLKMTHVPFRGAAESTLALLGGQVMLQTDAVSAIAPLLEAGQARMLLVWERERYPEYPDVPTAREFGLDLVYQSPYGLVGPRDMPPVAVSRLHDAFKQALEAPEHVAMLREMKQTNWYQSPENYAAYARRAWEDERKLLANVGLL